LKPETRTVFETMHCPAQICQVMKLFCSPPDVPQLEMNGRYAEPGVISMFGINNSSW